MKNTKTRRIAITGMFAAVAYILFFLQFKVPFMPSFISMDISELPALIASFSIGPVAGVVVCLIKNLIHLLQTSTGGVGELSNFLLGAFFVFPAGMIYKHQKSKKNAIIGCLVGSVVMAIGSVITNYFLVYPIYTKFMPMEAIIAAYQAINPKVNTLLDCLLVFNMPFTFVKGMLSVIITLLVYKRISPIVKG